MPYKFNPFTGTFDDSTTGPAGTVSAAGSGTAALPGISFASDPNTGIYSPSADNLAFSTGGTGRLFIDASGNIGVGVATPANPVDVLGSSGGAVVFNGRGRTSDNIGVIRLASSDSATEYFRIQTASSSSSVGTSGSTPLILNTDGTEKVRITAAGLLGLGTSNPEVELHINDATGLSHIRLTGGAANATNFQIGQGVQGVSNSGFSIYDIGATASRLVINSTGNVGIGTSAPGAKLHITDLTNSAVELLRLQVNLGSPSGNKSITWADTTDVVGRISVDYTAPTAKMRFGSLYNSGYQTSDLMTLTPTGLGIGSTTPDSTGVDTGSTQLFVVAPNANFGQAATFISDSNNRGILIANQAKTSSLAISSTTVGTNSSDPLVFTTGAAERARIDTSGRLLVGTSTSTSVGGAAALSQIETGANIGLSILRRGDTPIFAFGRTGGSGVTVVNNGDELGRISFAAADGTDIESVGAQISANIDGTPGSNDVPTRLVFSVTADGAASPTEALRISNDRSITVSDGGNVVLGTTTGTKIGTATTQKIGFYNATPVVQPTAVADATDAATVITQLNALLAKLRTLGIIAT
jgi:hypothetical protein